MKLLIIAIIAVLTFNIQKDNFNPDDAFALVKGLLTGL